jgi:PST family polysaccharide transporter
MKSSSIIGGSSVINILIGIVRTKVLAVLLGPAGMGLVGVYGSITELVSTLAGMGITFSGVRQIAEANGTGDRAKIARTIIAVRRVAFFLGILGAVLLAGLSGIISRITFDNRDHALALAIISLTIFFGAVSGGQRALIQGMRQIRNLAILGILGALFGTLFSIPIVYFWGMKGIPWYLVMLSAMGILTSWWYARKVQTEKVSLSWKEVWTEARPLLALGLVFMSSGLMGTATAYLIRMVIVRKLGIDAAGLFQSSFTLSSLYVGFILGAMGADFYPRLTAVAKDNEACRKLVNEQTEIGLLMAAPGVVATLAFAPWVIAIFYSSKFAPAVEVLRWQTLGVFLRVVSWPLGFLVLAKGAKRTYFMTEFAANLVHILLMFGLVHYFHLSGTGMAFFGLYVVYTILMLFCSLRLWNFSFSSTNAKYISIFCIIIAAAFCASVFLNPVASLILNTLLFLIVSAYCLRALLAALGIHTAAAILTRLRARFA